jgi:hypothetical protein
MLFVRRYHESVGYNGFLGGHLKLFHYASHVISSGLFTTRLYVTPENAVLDETLVPAGMQRTHHLAEADAYFLAGHDWFILDKAGIDTTQRPVINLLQGFAHLAPGDPRRDLLSRPALRICVSTALSDAVKACGSANGPLVAIENGTDVPVDRTPHPDTHSVFIAGLKNGTLAREIAEKLAAYGVEISLQTQSLPRNAFLEHFRQAYIAVLLPLEHEGFFLPALEAMALGCAVVIPRCEGTRAFCQPERSALITEYTADAIVKAVLRLRTDATLIQTLRAGGFAMAERHSLQRERSTFITTLRSYLRRA